MKIQGQRPKHPSRTHYTMGTMVEPLCHSPFEATRRDEFAVVEKVKREMCKNCLRILEANK